LSQHRVQTFSLQQLRSLDLENCSSSQTRQPSEKKPISFPDTFEDDAYVAWALAWAKNTRCRGDANVFANIQKIKRQGELI